MIKITNLTKVFPPNVWAVNNLSLDIKEDCGASDTGLKQDGVDVGLLQLVENADEVTLLLGR